MKKTGIRILSAILSIVLVFAAVPTIASAADEVQSGTCGSNINWTLDTDGVLALTGKGAMPSTWSFGTAGIILSGGTTVGSFLKDLWESIQKNGAVEAYAKDVKSIVIGEGITSVGTSAFATCANAESVTLPKTLTSIGKSAFAYTSLITVEIPASVTAINEAAFYGTKLEKVTFAAGSALKTIGDKAFAKTSLSSIIIPAAVTSIGSSICGESTVFEAYNVESANTKYSSSAGVLLSKDGTVLISYPDNIKNEKYSISSKVTTVNGGAFTNKNLTTITVPKSVTKINDNAFECPSLREIYNLSSLKIIAGTASNGGIAKYAAVVHKSDNEVSGFFTVGDFSFVTDGKIYSLYSYTGKDVHVILPSEIEYDGTVIRNYVIDSGAFKGSQIEYIEIPKEVTSIGASAFSGCESLATVLFANGSATSTVGNSAFAGCTKLKSINLPEGLVSIGDNAFNGDTAMISVNIPSTVKSIGASAFSGCTALRYVYFATGSMLGTLGDSVFSGDKALSSVKLPDTLTSVGKEAFKDCTSIKEITIPCSVKSIGESVFSGCTSLKDAVIEVGSVLGNIPSKAFENCSDLQSIIVPSSVESIGDSAFSGCTSLSEIYICNKKCDVNSSKATIPAEATIYGYKLSSARNYALLHMRAFSDISDMHLYSEATCTKPATCYICGKVNGTATGHKIGSWTVTVPATCMSSGLKTATCRICGEEFTEVIPAVGHSYSSWTYVTDSVTGSQYKQRYCSVCGEKDVQSIAVIDKNNTPVEPAVNYIQGDVDGDGTVTAHDARLAIRSVSGLDILTYVQSLAADVDGSGKVTSSDARKILRVAAQIDKF